jgi:hypothetical protein
MLHKMPLRSPITIVVANADKLQPLQFYKWEWWGGGAVLPRSFKAHLMRHHVTSFAKRAPWIVVVQTNIQDIFKEYFLRIDQSARADSSIVQSVTVRVQYDVSTAATVVCVVDQGYFLSPRCKDSTPSRVFPRARVRFFEAKFPSIEPLPDIAFS